MATRAKRGPVRLKDNKVSGPGWKFKKPGPNGDIPPLSASKFTDIPGQMVIPMDGEPQADEDAAGV